MHILLFCCYCEINPTKISLAWLLYINRKILSSFLKACLTEGAITGVPVYECFRSEAIHEAIIQNMRFVAQLSQAFTCLFSY